MDPLPGKHAASRLQGLINPKYQVHAYAVGLTVKNIYAVDPIGQVDFGGGEYLSAGRIAVGTQRRRREDKYEWWDLGRGSYFVKFNETLELAEDEIALLEPDERLLRAGAAHVPLFLRGRVAPIETLLQVDTVRIQIKQNARISLLRLFRFAPAVARVAPMPAAAERPKKAARKKAAGR